METTKNHMKTLDINHLAKALDGEERNIKLMNISPRGVSISTKEDLQNKIFVPLTGTKADGHDFITEAFAKGATLVFSQKDLNINMPYIRVESTPAALKAFAGYYRNFFDVPIVGITGSVGKTTTKDMTASILSQKYNTLKTRGNFNNEIGLPLTIFNLRENINACVLEMGMNQKGEIHNLARIARPTIAIITNIGDAHIEFLGSRENIFKAKSEILDYDPKDIILNGDDEMLIRLKSETKAKFYYLNDPAKEYTAYNIVHHQLKGTAATLKISGEEIHVQIPIPGDYMVRNALAGAVAGKILGLNSEEIKAGIESFSPSQNRMDITELGNLTLINDVYNASPAGVKSMLDLLAEQKGKRIAILGDMFELGEYAPSLHKELGEYPAENTLDLLISIGPLSQYIHENTRVPGYYFSTKEEFMASSIFKEILQEQGVVLVKASRGMYFEEIVNKIREIKQ